MIKGYKTLKGRWEIYVKRFTADFETVTWLKNKTYVWAWATSEIGNEENLEIGNNIEDFINYMKKNKNSYWYFHNLKFDGEFIIYYLETHGFKHIKDKKEIEDKTYQTVISDMGLFYNIIIYFKKGNKEYTKATIIDSLKIIPFSVDTVAKTFNLPISKLTIDYNKPRKKGHELTKAEKEYIKNDVLIMSKALKILFDEKLTQMTQGGNALRDYKNIITDKKFSHYFPKLTTIVDEKIRESYKGGFTYLSEDYIEKDVDEGTVIDVNSLYPYIMYSKKLPFGEPKYFEGEYEEDKVYDLYIQNFTCRFDLKPNKIPTIQIKNHIDFRGNEYLKTSQTSLGEDLVTLTLTNVDLKLFIEQYDVKEYTPNYGFKFRSIDKLFKDYIDKWIEVKIQATKDGNAGLRQIAKLMLNSLYGKFGSGLEQLSKTPYLGEDGVIHYQADKKDKEKDNESKNHKGIYIPMASFITSYARELTIRTSQAIMDYSIAKYGVNKYCYSDTDSIHSLLSIEELKQFCNIDDYELGAWKHESTFKKARFIRQKCYIEDINNKIEITCAGMPKQCYQYVDWNNFRTGFTCGGKLTFKHVIGGVVLEETEFTIKEEKVKKNIESF